MRLSTTVILRIEGSNTTTEAKAIRTKLALKLRCTERWVQKLIETNKDNGPLTTMASVKILQKELGLKQSEVLEEEKAVA